MRQVDRYFEKTTFAFTVSNTPAHYLRDWFNMILQCNNWAKRTASGRMLGYWPGSAVHQRATLEHPRFEDFDYESNDTDEIDRLAWMGNGMIMAQELNTSTTGYLDTVDKPPILATAGLQTPPLDGDAEQTKLKELGAGHGYVNGLDKGLHKITA